MTSKELHISLLRPVILHILRSAGFHAARPSVIDVFTDIAARYLTLLAQRTAAHAYSSHNDTVPDISDVRMAMQDCGLLIPTLTGSEEAWRELMRKPLEEYPERNGLRAKERERRDAEDTREVREFIDWFSSKEYKELVKFAGMLPNHDTPALPENETNDRPEDFLTALKKRHSKTGDESRFQGTLLGKPAEAKAIKIEGGPVESIHDWVRQTQERAAREAAAAAKNGQADGSRGSSPETLANSSTGASEDAGAAMDTTT